MKKILITTSSFGEYSEVPKKKLEEQGFAVTMNPFGRKLSLEESLKLYDRDIDGVIAGTETINEKVISSAVKLKVISRCGAGVDNVDLEAAKKRKIPVYNTPDGPTAAVAELTVGLMLNLLRNVSRMDADMKSGKWCKMPGNLLQGKRIGIVGFGRIGQKVAELLSVFSVELAYCDLEEKKTPIACERKNIGDLLAWADIITLHMFPAKDKSPFLKGSDLKGMKKGSWLINASRGGVVDEKALYECLKEKQIAGAAVDVFEQEPYNGPLRELDNVILTPHIGSFARESRTKMELEAVENLIKGLKERGNK